MTNTASIAFVSLWTCAARLGSLHLAQTSVTRRPELKSKARCRPLGSPLEWELFGHFWSSCFLYRERAAHDVIGMHLMVHLLSVRLKNHCKASAKWPLIHILCSTRHAVDCAS